MSQYTAVIGLDLGTSATTASHCLVRDSFDADGNLHREKCLRGVTDVKDWPGGDSGTATGNVCLPTDLVYVKSLRKLLCWGFEAQQFLDDPFPGISPDDIFVVEHIKLLLPDPDEAKNPSAASTRYRAMRENLIANLGKQPYEVFEESLNEVVDHVVKNVIKTYFRNSKGLQIELVLAFPSGWPAKVHTNVARIGTSAMEKAITMNSLEDIVFGRENVYTVSETLCGVKEWLRAAVAEGSLDLDLESTNLDELNEGDYFLPVDIGGERALEVSGEAVQAEFERWIRPRITKKDYSGDIPRLINRICRLFKEEKKNCGVPSRMGFLTWNFQVLGLKANPLKGFEKNGMKIERKLLDRCFDPAIDVLVHAIEETMLKFPLIKAIVFLGQFGGSSKYLQKQIASRTISRNVKICHSGSGKLDVVKGALSERLSLGNSFVRKYQTLKSYGTLVTLLYGPDAAKIFPNPWEQGAVPFERSPEGLRLKVVEWAVPQGTILENGLTCNVDQNDRRFHAWNFSEEHIDFEDIIIVSDEPVPHPQLNGKSYTLWTTAHVKNELFINNRRIQVQQLSFSWNLQMSRKIDRQGNKLGPYTRDDLRSYMYPEKIAKGHRRKRFRDLHYELIWHITEMQVKVYILPIFPNQLAPSKPQLAKERFFVPEEKSFTGESRSKDLEKDIEIEKGPGLDLEQEEDEDGHEVALEGERGGELDDICGTDGLLLIEALASEHQEHIGGESARTFPHEAAKQQPQTSHGQIVFTESDAVESLRITLPTGQLQQLRPSQELPGDVPHALAVTSSNAARLDDRSRNGCYTCKDRKKECDCLYELDDTSGHMKCNSCLRHRISCYPTQPKSASNRKEGYAKQLERKRLVRLGKRKAREESSSSEFGSSGRSSDRSMTARPSEHSTNPLTRYQSIEAAIDSDSSLNIGQSSAPLRRGTHTAIRGGKRGSKLQIH